MFSTPTKPILRAGLAALFLLTAGIAAGVPLSVTNDSGPAEGLVTAKLVEQWRHGGDDDDLFFGFVGSTDVDTEGNVLILDTQLSQVHVIGPDGELLRTVCKEGDGPGEARRPGDVFVTADGTICLLQGFPGRIIKLNPDGTPAGEGRYTTGQTGEGQFAVLNSGHALPQGMLLAGITMNFGGGSVSQQNYFLSVCDQEGKQQRKLLAKQNPVDYADLEMSELGMDFPWNRAAAGPDGTVYCAPDREKYEIQVFGDGTDPVRVFGRPYQAINRTAEQKDIQRRILEGIAAYYPAPLKRTKVEDRPPAIAGIYPTEDGLVWVQTYPGITPVPEGCWSVLDVFDQQGRFLRQVALPGDFDQDRDGINVLRDGRIIVTLGVLEAFLNQQAVEGDAEASADVILEVICYELEI